MKKKVLITILAFAILCLGGCEASKTTDKEKETTQTTAEEINDSSATTAESEADETEAKETEVEETETEESDSEEPNSTDATAEETEAETTPAETEETEETTEPDSSDNDADNTDATNKDSTNKDSTNTDTAETEPAETEPTNTDAADTEASTTDSAKADAEAALYDKLAATTGNATIQSFICDDFDLNGTYEAFAFVGEENDYDGEILYSGEYYFINDNTVEMIKESYPVEFADCGTVIDFGTRKYFHVKQIYTTAGVSYLYSVNDEGYFEDNYSGIGSLYNLDGNDFCLSLSAYDGIYDVEMDTTIGHTWKPYYFHYDPSADAIVEYLGESISVEIAYNSLPAGVIDEIRDQGYTLSSMYMRDNGVINVNYEMDEGNSIRYSNVNYDTVTGKFMDAWGNGTDTWEDSDFGGIYYRSIYGE